VRDLGAIAEEHRATAQAVQLVADMSRLAREGEAQGGAAQAVVTLDELIGRARAIQAGQASEAVGRARAIQAGQASEAVGRARAIQAGQASEAAGPLEETEPIVGTVRVFRPLSDISGAPGFADRAGRDVYVVCELGDHERPQHSEDLGTMYRAVFADGQLVDVWPREVEARSGPESVERWWTHLDTDTAREILQQLAGADQARVEAAALRQLAAAHQAWVEAAALRPGDAIESLDGVAPDPHDLLVVTSVERKGRTVSIRGIGAATTRVWHIQVAAEVGAVVVRQVRP
jgi:hypothetical protein